MFDPKLDVSISEDDYSFESYTTEYQPPQESDYSTPYTSFTPPITTNNKLISKTESLKISIIGLGYVGAVSCACFTSLGHQVIGVDPELSKVNAINEGHSPIVEPQLEELLTEAHKSGKLKATADIEQAILISDITLVSVGTPSKKDGGCDLSYLKAASEQIGHALAKKTSYHVVIFRSTVPPTTTNKILIPLLEASANKICGKDFGVCFNPEFLRESTAIDDFYHPPKTVLGSYDNKSIEFAKRLYKGVEGDIIHTSIEAAEFVKYIDNTWHALKVSFGNEVGRICKALKVDSHEVMDIFLQDTKLNISPYYLKPGFAFGGSCLPKDTRGIVSMAKELNVNIPIIEHINQSNHFHIAHTMNMIEQLPVSKVAIVGLTFKADTDDLRESPSLELLKQLLKKGYQVQFYDPCIASDIPLDMDPEINRQLNAARCNSLSRLTKINDAFVITHKKSYSEKIINNCSKDQHIIDVVHLASTVRQSENYHGLCW